jgi:peptide/nickel transport system substrate-binding protein
MMSSLRTQGQFALRLSAVAAGGTLLLSGCSVANSEGAGGATAASSDTIRVVLQQEPPTLEPCEANLTSTGVVDRLSRSWPPSGSPRTTRPGR